MRQLVVLAALAGCSGRSEPTGAPPAVHPGDGGIDRAVVVDPGSARFDDDSNRRPAPPPSRASHPIDITLRSSPPGAQAAVDGTPVGNTPTYWSGDANGREHEFTFMLAGHAVARYRFVPITSGVIHARLEPIADEPDAGAAGAPPPEVMPAPSPQPGSAIVPAPGPVAPPSLPADAALVVPPVGSGGLGPQP